MARCERDPDVMAAWASLHAGYKSPFAAARIVTAVLFVPLLAHGMISRSGYADVSVALAFVSIAICMSLNLVAYVYEHRTFLCPHCGRCPDSAWGQSNPRAADFCDHCLYWLRPPQGS